MLLCCAIDSDGRAFTWLELLHKHILQSGRKVNAASLHRKPQAFTLRKTAMLEV